MNLSHILSEVQKLIERENNNNICDFYICKDNKSINININEQDKEIYIEKSSNSNIKLKKLLSYFKDLYNNGKYNYEVIDPEDSENKINIKIDRSSNKIKIGKN